MELSTEVELSGGTPCDGAPGQRTVAAEGVAFGLVIGLSVSFGIGVGASCALRWQRASLAHKMMNEARADEMRA